MNEARFRPARSWGLAGILFAVVAALLLAVAFVTVQDARANRAVRVVRSVTVNAVDTGEVAALKRLAAGGRIEARDLESAIAFVRQRNDCADFRLITLLRARYAYGQAFSPEAEARLREALLGFRYWMDEAGPAGPLVYWSENHQILFAADEFLAGGLYPAAVFADGRTGVAHRAAARDRILFWLDQRWRFGFSEWNSHYYLEDIAALANLVDFARDPEVSSRSAIVLDLLMLDLAGHSIHGEFVATSGRLYQANAMGGDAAIRRVLRHAFAEPQDPADAKELEINFLLSGYRTPPALRAVAADPGVAVMRASTGRDPGELRADPALSAPGRRIMAAWGMEAFTDPRTIALSARYVRDHGLLANPFLAGFRQLNYRVLLASGALPVLSRALDLPSNGTVLGRADTYALRTPDYLMSTTQAFRPGGYGNQQRVFVMTFDPGVTLFHGHPAVRPGDPPPNGSSPGYWTGSGRLPLSCQDGPVNLSLYRLPRTPGLGRPYLLEFTHLHAPTAQSDRVLLEGNRLFLQRKDALAAVTAAVPLRQVGGSEFIQPGRDTFWITEAGSARQESFEAFAARIRAAPAVFDGRTLTYRSRGRTHSAGFEGGCAVDGAPLRTAYDRYDAPYGHAARNPRRIRLAFGGHSLDLDFARGIREVR